MANDIMPIGTSVSGLFLNEQSFILGQRMAQALASSTIVPKDYQNNVGNTLIAVEMAARLNTSPLMVMQHLYIVNGRPAWSSQYIVAMINSSRKYKTELQYEMQGEGDDLSCYAWTTDHNDHKVYGPTITMKMAKDEGWVSKNGSKWKTMPEVMIRYRAASFFGRLNCPDMIMGIYSADEVVEMPDIQYVIADDEISAEEEIASQANQIPIDIPDGEDKASMNEENRIDAETGEVADETPTSEKETEKTRAGF